MTGRILLARGTHGDGSSLEEEAGSEREHPAAAMTVFEFHHAALDAHDGATEVGRDILKHEIGQGLDDGQYGLRRAAVEVCEHV